MDEKGEMNIFHGLFSISYCFVYDFYTITYYYCLSAAVSRVIIGGNFVRFLLCVRRLSSREFQRCLQLILQCIIGCEKYKQPFLRNV